MRELLLSWLLALPPWAGDNENPVDRRERLSMVADACNSAIDNARCSGAWTGADWCVPVWTATERELGAALVTLWFFESGGAKHVHEGRCRLSLGECDPYRARGRLYHRAVSPWQIQRSAAIADLWREARDGGATPAATFAGCMGAATVFGRAYARCGGLEGAFSGYARGNSCSWSGARRRANFARRLMVRVPTH